MWTFLFLIVVIISFIMGFILILESATTGRVSKPKRQPIVITPTIPEEDMKKVSKTDVEEKMCLPGKPKNRFTWDSLWKDYDADLLDKSLTSLIIPKRCPKCDRKVESLVLVMSPRRELTTYSCPNGHGWGLTIE